MSGWVKDADVYTDTSLTWGDYVKDVVAKQNAGAQAINDLFQEYLNPLVNETNTNDQNTANPAFAKRAMEQFAGVAKALGDDDKDGLHSLLTKNTSVFDSWKGPAADQFKSVYDTITTYVNDMKTVAETYSAQAKKIYESHDGARSKWNSQAVSVRVDAKDGPYTTFIGGKGYEGVLRQSATIDHYMWWYWHFANSGNISEANHNLSMVNKALNGEWNGGHSWGTELNNMVGAYSAIPVRYKTELDKIAGPLSSAYNEARNKLTPLPTLNFTPADNSTSTGTNTPPTYEAPNYQPPTYQPPDFSNIKVPDLGNQRIQTPDVPSSPGAPNIGSPPGGPSASSPPGAPDVGSPPGGPKLGSPPGAPDVGTSPTGGASPGGPSGLPESPIAPPLGPSSGPQDAASPIGGSVGAPLGLPTSPNGNPLSSFPNAKNDLVRTPDGRSGFDLNGDRLPDIDTNGNPVPGGVAPPGSKIVPGPDGQPGVDLNGDGIPDVDLAGRALPGGAAPPGGRLVRGSDGAFGFDTDGDGVPNVDLNGHAIAVQGPPGPQGPEGPPGPGVGAAPTPPRAPGLDLADQYRLPQDAGQPGQGYPMIPPMMMGGMGMGMGGGMGGQGQEKKERERQTWLAEDEEAWLGDAEVATAVLGRPVDEDEDLPDEWDVPAKRPARGTARGPRSGGTAPTRR